MKFSSILLPKNSRTDLPFQILLTNSDIRSSSLATRVQMTRPEMLSSETTSQLKSNAAITLSLLSSITTGKARKSQTPKLDGSLSTLETNSL